MGPELRDRVRDTSTTTGTGTLTLVNSAPAGFRTFGSAVANADTVCYSISHQSASEWEIGYGTYTSSGTTLSRTTVLYSSNSGALVNFSAGTKDVFITIPAALVNWLPKIVPPPAVSGWTWLNQGGATATDVKGGIVLEGVAAEATETIRGIYRTAPSTPWTFTAQVIPRLLETAATGLPHTGVMITDGTKVITLSPLLQAGVTYIYSRYFTGVTTFSSNVINAYRQCLAMSPLILQVGDDGTNLTFKVLNGRDGSYTVSVTRASYFTPTGVGVYATSFGGASLRPGLFLSSWEQG